MLKITTWKDPYDAGFSITTRKELEIKEGLTVLVGCNGAGKTTTLMNIKEETERQHIAHHHFDNLQDGGRDSFASVLSGFNSFECDNTELAASMWSASEGELIKLNISRQSSAYKKWLQTAIFDDRHNIWKSVFGQEEKQQEYNNQRVLTFDATDSGLSIDNIIELKQLFELIQADANQLGLQLYIIISANEYELCRNEQCLDVNTGEYITFRDYESYRKFIISNRNKKEKRIEKQIRWHEKQKQKELATYEKLKTKTAETIEKIKQKAATANRQLTYSEKYKIRNLEDILQDFIRNAKYNSF